MNNGVCVDEIAGYRCECMAGFRGENCQESIDMCSSPDPCMNNSTCVNLRTDFNCICEPGWDGKYCEKNIDECAVKPCQNNATCVDLINDYKCECPLNWTGKNCSVDFDDCAINPCSSGAKRCIDKIGDYTCDCHEGWIGKRCEIDIDECQLNPCENNGNCTNLANENNLAMFAGFKCTCEEEYQGFKCEEKKKCYTKSVLELCKHQRAECRNEGSSYECLISASFDGSGSHFATYRANGKFVLESIDIKYRSLTGGIIMSFETNQTDSPVADLQLNRSGLYLNGQHIKLRDEDMKFPADEYLDGTEKSINITLNTPTEIKSISLSKQLSLINNNDNNNLSTNDQYTFQNLAPHFKGCLIEVRLNKLLLPLVDYYDSIDFKSEFGNNFDFMDNRLDIGQCKTCFEKDCMNEGRCESSPEGYDHCGCPKAFTGLYCETDVNECEANPNACLNGGICENYHGGYRCSCKDGYRGKYKFCLSLVDCNCTPLI